MRAWWNFSVAQEYRGWRGRQGLRRGQEGKGAQAASIGGHRGIRAQSPKVHSAKVMDYEGIKTLLRRADERFPRLSHLWLDAGYRGEDKGAETGCGKPWGGAWRARRAPPKARPRRGVDDLGEGVGQRRRGRRLAETIAPQRLCGVAEEVGGGADVVMDRPEPEDELMDYERLCASGEALVYAAMIRPMTRRLARV